MASLPAGSLPSVLKIATSEVQGRLKKFSVSLGVWQIEVIIRALYFNIALQKHAYSSIQKISPPKTENFQIKKLLFFIFLLKT